MRCVAIDQRGWGRSIGLETGCAIEDLAADATVVIEELELDDYILVGHSMGGKVAQLLATRRPEGLREGEITYTVGPEGETIAAGPGAGVWIPPGAPHSFKVTSGPARALNFYTPGGFDDQFSYLATPATQKTLPPEHLAPINSSARDEYLARIRDLHQESLLTEQKSW